MRYSMNDKVALITGSTSGLGREIALQLCSIGAKVVLHGRDVEKLDRTVSEFRELGYDPAAIAGDISSTDDCKDLIEGSIATFGRIDILVNNAGVGSVGAFEDTSPETFRKVFEVNTLGTIIITRLALPHLIRSRGSVIFISSLAGLTGLPYSSLYSSSKMALTAIGQALNEEVTGRGVHVGIFYAGFLKNGPDKKVMGPHGNMQPTGDRKSFRLQPMEDAARMIIQMIRKRKRIKVVSTLGKIVYWGMRLAPWLVRGVLRASRAKVSRTYESQN
jgi:short-subunit dehydrogenase